MSAEPKTKHVYHGMGSLQLLGVVFVTLKLCGVIDWSWWLVLLPFYGPIAIALAIVIVGAFVFAAMLLFGWISDWMTKVDETRQNECK